MIKGIIFDMGGVLVYDVQEPLFFDSKNGLIVQYGLKERKVAKAVRVLWEKYAYTKKIIK